MSDLSDAIRLVYTQQYIYWDVVQKLAEDDRQARLEEERFIVSLGNV